jgi:hypothetical protein
MAMPGASGLGKILKLMNKYYSKRYQKLVEFDYIDALHMSNYPRSEFGLKHGVTEQNKVWFYFHNKTKWFPPEPEDVGKDEVEGVE